MIGHLTLLCLGVGIEAGSPRRTPVDGEGADPLRKVMCCYQKKVGSMLERLNKKQVAIRAGKLDCQDYGKRK